MYIFGRASSLAWCLPDVGAALERAGHQLRPTKCSFWAPALDAVADSDLAQPLKTLLAKFPRAVGGMTLLGGAVNGELAVHVDAHSIALELARARAERAARLANRIRDFTVAHPVPETTQVAWMLLAKCVAHALSYDARLVPSAAPKGVDGDVHTALWQAIEVIIPGDMNSVAQRRLALSGSFGGCGLRREAHGLFADAGFWAAWTTKSDRVRAVAHALGRPVPACHGAEDARDAAARLQLAGVSVTNDGAVALTKEGRDLYFASGWSADQALTELGALAIEPPSGHPGPDALPSRAFPPAATPGFPRLQSP